MKSSEIDPGGAEVASSRRLASLEIQTSRSRASPIPGLLLEHSASKSWTCNGHPEGATAPSKTWIPGNATNQIR